MPERMPQPSPSFKKVSTLVGPTGVFCDGDWVESKDQDPNGEVRLIQLSDIGEGEFRDRSQRFLTMKRAQEIGCTFLKEGDVLIARMADPLGRACLFPGVGQPAVTAVDICIARSDQTVADNRWLMWILNTPQVRALSERESRGTTRKRISRLNLGAIPVPVPPLPEQKRIVAKLDELMAEIKATKAHLARAKEILRRFRQSVLSAAVTGKLTKEWRRNQGQVQSVVELMCQVAEDRRAWYADEVTRSRMKGQRSPAKPRLIFAPFQQENWPHEIPSTWVLATFDDLAAPAPNAIKAGPFGSSLTKSAYSPAGHKVYGQEQVIRGDHEYGSYFIDEEKYRELSACAVGPGDILVSLVGTIGKVLVLPASAQAGIINPRLVKLSLHSLIDNAFIKTFLESQIAHDWLAGVSHGGTMEIINLQILRALPIPIPPREEQALIVRKVEEYFRLVEPIEDALDHYDARLDAISSSMLGTAFRGELVHPA